ncbi:hypothetical protein V1260_06970 [Brachybacterium sp. J144]|uniref:hypothetical protein n=1 Tax=Brachybacterium sp. J144 TaxID=3116487 RepID=UPI002E790453|nr:hypothetical protein [Brachybacterium sp. J144]MEE1650531.1 hypothetical protein [Brachybacterium sp. J144]
MIHPVPSTAPAAPGGSPSPGGSAGRLAALGCLMLAIILVVGLGGYFGIGALMSRGDPRDGEETSEAPTSPVQTFGKDEAQPFGTPLLFTPRDFTGEVVVTLDAMDWQAGGEIAEANTYNDPAPAGSRYIMVTATLENHADVDFGIAGGISVQYVEEDGTVHDYEAVVVPVYEDTDDVPAGGSLQWQWAYLVPEDAAEGGHFVLSNFAPELEDGQWVEAA